MFPTSIFDALARNEILQVVVFALFFGFSTSAIGKRGKVVVDFLDASSHVILKMTTIIMNFAPLAVFGAITVVIAKQGIGILQTYSLFISEFYLGLFLLLGVFIVACFAIIGRKVRSLLSHIRQPTLLAFSTNSSEAAFPSLMVQLERFGCNERIVSFVLPLGYSFNLAGSMMYMAFASLFLGAMLWYASEHEHPVQYAYGAVAYQQGYSWCTAGFARHSGWHTGYLQDT